jgi:hypothetical protein
MMRIGPLGKVCALSIGAAIKAAPATALLTKILRCMICLLLVIYRLCERSAAIHGCEFGLWIAALRSQ